MPDCAVAIMAKAPTPGQVKTRLCPPLSYEEAADLYRCFLLDKIEQVKALKGAERAIAYTPEDSKSFFETLASPAFLFVLQTGPDLGARLINTLTQLLALGYRKVMAIDSDTPTLPVDHLRQGFALLNKPEIDVVLGPCEDGGYYLIGVREIHRELFDDMAWREGRVLCSHEADDGRACATKLLWTRVQGGVTKALNGTTLAELVEFAEQHDDTKRAVAGTAA